MGGFPGNGVLEARSQSFPLVHNDLYLYGDGSGIMAEP